MSVLLDVIANRNDFYMYIFIPSCTGMKNMLCLRVVAQGRKRVGYSSETISDSFLYIPHGEGE